MRKEALNQISRLVDEDSRVVFIGSDLGAGVMAEAMERHPSRVLMEGIAEQHLVGMAGGLALEGFVPFVHTIGTFLTRRALEQVIVDAALHRLPVRLISSGGGMVYAPLGPTHQAIDDFALMRAIPGMAVLAPIDPMEMEEAIGALVEWPGPAYVRLGKGGEPVVTEAGFTIGGPRLLRHGSQLLILTTGAIGHEVLAAADALQGEEIHVSVAHIPTIAPLAEREVLKLVQAHDKTLVVEEHLPNGGLWTSVVEAAMRNEMSATIRQASLPDKYAQEYGSQSDHWKACGLSAEGLKELCLSLVGGSERG